MVTGRSKVAVLGSTGSIGLNALDVIAASPHRLELYAISAHRQLDLALQQARLFRPRFLISTFEDAASHLVADELPPETMFRTGYEALDQVVTDPEVDVIVAGIVGCAGLRSTWAALAAGKRVALANKEALVVAGPLLGKLLDHSKAELIPVDSEHSAIFQAMFAGRREDVRRVILTASGGPFRDYSVEQLQHVTVQQALEHPTWEMGAKITVDSATMMNKALEIVEARWLFDLQPDQIQVVIHPQSIIHSMVEFRDGSTVAQMSPPDMRMPIQFALSYPERWECPAPPIDFSRDCTLEFYPPDPVRFPAIALGMDVARRGGTAGAVMNAANEVAVQWFMDGRLEFSNIVPICRQLVDDHPYQHRPTLEQLLEMDAWARREAAKWVCT